LLPERDLSAKVLKNFLQERLDNGKELEEKSRNISQLFKSKAPLKLAQFMNGCLRANSKLSL